MSTQRECMRLRFRSKAMAMMHKPESFANWTVYCPTELAL
jgi:hypothetical protein